MDYDKFMRKADSLQARNRDYVSVFQQKVKNDPDPYAPPTLVSKGTVSTTLGGLVDLLDKSGGTTVFTYDPTTGSVTINGRLSITQPIGFGSTTAIQGDLLVGGSTVLQGNAHLIDKSLIIQNQTNGNAKFSIFNDQNTERIKFGISSDGFGKGTIDELTFNGNTNNKMVEFFGPSMVLADSSGVHGFNVYNSNGQLLWMFASNGEVYQGLAKFWEFKGNASDPGNAPADKLRLYVDESAGKNRLMARFQSGTAVVIAQEP